MFFKTCGKYTSYFLIAKKNIFLPLFPFTYTIGLAKD